MGEPKRRKRPGEGRPTNYKPEYAEQAAMVSELGATDLELAKLFNVNVATIYRWKAAHQEFCEAVKVGKKRADDRVVASLYQRALGYDYQAQKVFFHRGKVLSVRAMEHIPADVGAAINWLKNRRPEVWREKQAVELQHSFAHLSDEELRLEILALLGEVGGVDDLVAPPCEKRIER